MNFLNNLIPNEYMQALGWTLLHSIWQAAVVALLVGILMIFLQKSSKTRYAVAAGAMPLILLFSLITFFISFEKAVKISEKEPAASQLVITNNLESGIEEIISEKEIQSTSFLENYKFYFTNHFPLIITLWFLGILVLSLKFLGGLAYVQRLKRYKVLDITPQWESKIKNLSQKIGLNKTIRLLESSMVSVPMVVGYFKPVILLPIGAVTGLTPNQIESILAHELAHIARKDYLVNIFQTLIEILFFFHPAIWWISSRVREERENCCDDIAVQVNDNTLVYAKALTTLGALNTSSPQFAMAATGQNGILFKRIKRMLTKPTQHPTFSEGFITACALFVCIFCFSLVVKASLSSTFYEPVSTEITEASAPFEGEFSAVVLNVEDSSGNDDNLIIVKNKKGKIVELYVNGRKVPKSEIKNYEPLIQESLAQQQDEQSIGNKFTPEDEKKLQSMVEELKEEKRPQQRREIKEEIKEEVKEEVREEVKEERKQRIQENLKKDHEEVVNSFVQKTLEISRIGMEIGSVSMELENLKRKMERAEDPEKYESEVRKLENKIEQLEAKAEKLGEEMESAGEEFGKWSLDLSTSIMDSVMDGFKFEWDYSDDDTEEDNENVDDEDQ